MLTKMFLIGAAALLLAGAPALAATPSGSKMTATKIAATNTAATHAAMKKAHHHHRRMKKVSMRGDDEVRALNALEAAGYRQFDNLHAKGTDFVATATRSGKTYDVTVQPSGSIQASPA